ncbi:hypothetical protein, partial [Cypionkella sp.]|uniref:hypothetical protein n=1 Tax=Cypionkella sp. TaxID=2811411 RepID=UPI00260F3905
MTLHAEPKALNAVAERRLAARGPAASWRTEMHPSNVRSVLSDNKTTLVALGVAAATVYVGYAMAKSAGQNRVVDRPHDDMPVRT